MRRIPPRTTTPVWLNRSESQCRLFIVTRVIPELDEFRPEVLLISAGFDAHRDDQLAHVELSEEGFEIITRLLAGVADHHCGGRIISALEGGYNLRALGRSVVRHLIGLS